MRIMHVATEMFPYVKVGGLGDVMGALPAAQKALGDDVRVLMPGFQALLQGVGPTHEVGSIPDLLGQGPARFLLGRTGAGVPIYLLDCPGLFDRPGGPYEELGDSHIKFAALCWGAAFLARTGDQAGWLPEVVQCHDWQAGLIPVYLAQPEGHNVRPEGHNVRPEGHNVRPEGHPGQPGGARPKTVMTIHNISYQGIYDPGLLADLWLDPATFHPEGLEFFGKINFLKAGLAYADRISTVSPTYAREIQTPASGAGLDGLLAHRRRDLSGILNGVDYKIWNPASSPHLEYHYDARRLSVKKVDKNLLQRSVGLDESANEPLFAVVSRLAEQKGLDLVLENVAYLIQLSAQLLILGTGDPELEAGFRAAAAAHPGRVAAVIGYDEGMAHRVLAGADVILVPSRQEPCGLTQLYGLRYGTLPLVRRAGGLADTVVDCDAQSMLDSTATGFVFNEPSSWILGETIGRACRLYREDPHTWAQVQRHAMGRNFSWESSAREYRELYQGLLA